MKRKETFESMSIFVLFERTRRLLSRRIVRKGKMEVFVIFAQRFAKMFVDRTFRFVLRRSRRRRRAVQIESNFFVFRQISERRKKRFFFLSQKKKMFFSPIFLVFARRFDEEISSFLQRQISRIFVVAKRNFLDLISVHRSSCFFVSEKKVFQCFVESRNGLFIVSQIGRFFFIKIPQTVKFFNYSK